MQLIPVKIAFLMETREQIFSKNLYAADALYAITSVVTQCVAFLTFDSDFKGDIQEIPIINLQENFRQKITSLLQY